MQNHIVIMAGGVGSRLFPLSTPDRPKQFIDLLGCGKTLIRLTYERFLVLDPDAVFWVVTSDRFVHFVQEQIPEIPACRILAEPAPRNTAPCIAYACWKIKARYPDANIAVTPADAYVPDCESFAATMRSALDFTARRDAIVCIGIKPTSPHSGYGYIQEGQVEEGPVREVLAFKEKPSPDVARQYLAEGCYRWNAGIFVWNAATIEEELRAYAPGICDLMDELTPSLYTESEQKELERIFPRCEKISIDYAVMEKSSVVYTIGADWEWSDLGSFEAIAAITGKDPRENLPECK